MSLVVICPKRIEDPRGWFSETWNAAAYAKAGIHAGFCQDNLSQSRKKYTLRGLHYQAPPFAQAKLVSCIRGRIFDVAVDIRRASPTFGQWIGTELSSDSGRQLFIPAGYAHGFVTLEDECIVAYKVSAPYSPPDDRSLAWDDPSIDIAWPLEGEPILSEKDARAPRLGTLTEEFPYDGVPLSDPTQVLL
jgi:dTDP-4-dehydrorhamnose 3,5-epimerase